MHRSDRYVQMGKKPSGSNSGSAQLNDPTLHRPPEGVDPMASGAMPVDNEEYGSARRNLQGVFEESAAAERIPRRDQVGQGSSVMMGQAAPIHASGAAIGVRITPPQGSISQGSAERQMMRQSTSPAFHRTPYQASTGIDEPLSESEAGATRLITTLSNLMRDFTAPLPDLKADIAMNLFRSSVLWSNELILELSDENAAYIVSMLKSVGTLRSSGSLSSRETLLAIKSTFESEGYDMVKRISFAHLGKTAILSEDEGMQEIPKQLTATGKKDHRGLPVMTLIHGTRVEKPMSALPALSQAETGVDSRSDIRDPATVSPGSNVRDIQDQNEASREVGKYISGSKDPDGDDDSSDSDDDRPSRPRRRDRFPRRSSGGESDEKLSKGNSLKLAIQMFARNDAKWSGPGDVNFSTGEFIKHFLDVMDICDATNSIRMKVLPFALKDDALDEFNQNLRDDVRNGSYRSAKGVILAISHSLETAEFKMENKNQWSSMTLDSVRAAGEPLERSFARLKKRARKLQSRLGGAYLSEAIFCDFFRRALQDEAFWMYVDDSDPNITSEVLFSKVNLAIQRYRRETSRSPRHTETMATNMTNRRFGVPDRKRAGSFKNPKYRDGTVMECTGCGSRDHLYRECRNPNKVEFRKNKLEQIDSMRRGDRKKYIRSYYTQLSDDENTDSGTEIDEIRSMAEELKSNLHESMFLESVPHDESMKLAFDECMLTQTRHVFFGSTRPSQKNKRIGIRTSGKPISTKLRYPDSQFPGIMIDNGSTGSLCSEAQLQAYRSFTGNPTPVRPLKNHYAVSAHGGSKCIGIATFKFPYHDTVIKFDAPIVENSDIPLILGLDDQDKLLSPGVNQRDDTISFLGGAPMPVLRDRGHLWIRWNYEYECLFTEKELTKLHYRFVHPRNKRMHKFLKRASPDKVDKDTLSMLEKIQARCKECQYLAPKPFVVKVSVPHDGIVFNSEVVIDIMWIQGKHVLHVVDRATHFQAARFIPDDSTETIWRTFMQMWVLVYLGPPDNLRHDQGTQFVSPKLQAMAAEAGISCRPVGIEGAHAMGVGERYHAPLRKTFLKLQKTYQIPSLDTEVPEGSRGPGRPRKNPRKVTRSVNVEDEFLLSIAVMAVNTTIGPEGLCPILLVFGAMPKLPLPDSGPAAVPQAERMMMLETAREEYIDLVAKIRLKQSEKAFIPSRPPITLQYGDKVLVYRESGKRWEPRMFVSRNENTILVAEPNGDVQPYPITKVSELKEGVYLPRPDIYGIDREDEKHADSRPAQPKSILPKGQEESIKAIGEEIDDSYQDVQMDLSSNKPVSKENHSTFNTDDLLSDSHPFESFQLEIEDTECVELRAYFETYQTIVLSNGDPRRKLFKEAIEAEVKGLFENDTFIVVKKSDFTYEEIENMTILKAKLVLAYKDPTTSEERKKARLVVQAIGKLDKDKKLLFTYSPTVKRSSIRIMLCIPTKIGLKIYLRDISQAYVSSKSKLLREVYVIPPKELGLGRDILWKVIRPLYGLPESGLIWFETYVGHHHDELRMKSTEADPCFMYRKGKDESIDGLVCLQVDDSIGAGTPKFLQEESDASKSFKTRTAEILNDGKEVRFNGHYVKQSEQTIIVHQHPYEQRIPSEKVERSPDSFMSNRGKASYLASCTRPDIACAVNQLSQRKADEATEEDFKRLDTALKQLREESVELLYGNVDLETAEVHVFADASFATNADLSSQLGYVVFLVDQDRNCSLITWSSSKCKRVTRSVLAAELYAIANAFDVGFAIGHTFESILGRKVELRVFTDSRTLFDSIISFCSMTEKRLLIDIACLRQAFRSGELSNLGWIRSGENVADALTKDKSKSALHNVLRSHKLNVKVSQWVSEGMIPDPRTEC